MGLPKKGEKYNCSVCLGTFTAVDDGEHHLGSESMSDDDVGIICDNCYKEFSEYMKNHPELMPL